MANKKEVLKEACERYQDFITLCVLLFGEDPIQNVNELKKDSPYYSTAKEIVDEFEMDWDHLSAADSDEVVLALLDDYFNRIKADDKLEFDVSVTVREKKAVKAKDA